ncbi:MAG: shikimate kinase [Spirochaetales bacterium]
MKTDFALVVLMGMKHCGKTTVGKLLARKRNLVFQDLDSVVEALFTEKTGNNYSVREIYKIHGKEEFQKGEAEAIRYVLQRVLPDSKRKPLILALGGGTIENREALSLLDPFAVFIYLEEAEEVLLRRILQKGIPSFLDPKNPEGEFHRLYLTRTALFASKAHRVVSTNGKSPEEVVEELNQRILPPTFGEYAGDQ